MIYMDDLNTTASTHAQLCAVRLIQCEIDENDEENDETESVHYVTSQRRRNKPPKNIEIEFLACRTICVRS